MSEESIEELKFKCEFCDKEFDPDPDAMVEWCMEPCKVKRCEAEEDENFIPADDLANMNEFDLKAIGLRTDQRDALLNGETVVTGGKCICLECQDEMAADQLD